MDENVIKSQIVLTQAALTAALTTPAPNYSVSGPDGAQSISYADYIEMLTRELKALQELLIIIEPYWLERRQIL